MFRNITIREASYFVKKKKATWLKNPINTRRSPEKTTTKISLLDITEIFPCCQKASNYHKKNRAAQICTQHKSLWDNRTSMNPQILLAVHGVTSRETDRSFCSRAHRPNS